MIESISYSTVAKEQYKGLVGFADVTFDFSITYRSPALSGKHYSEYQLFLYRTISEYIEQGMTFDAIAEWLNKEGHLPIRGKKFSGAHVHSIAKKRKRRLEILDRKPTLSISNINFKYKKNG